MSPASGERVRALAGCLGVRPRASDATLAWLRAWAAAGFDAPLDLPPGGGPPDPRGSETPDLRLAGHAAADDLRAAAHWAASATFPAGARRAALELLTDVLAIGASAPARGFLSRDMAEAVLDPAPEEPPDGGGASLWRPVGGRRRAAIGRAILWNRMAGDPLELHAGPECVAAAASVAEARGRTLGELLDAVAVGCGIGAWHRDLVGAAMEAAGVHSPGALAPVASAAAVSRLLGYGPGAMERALRLADSRTPMHPYRAFAEGFSVKLAYGAWGQALGAAAALESGGGVLSETGAPPEPAHGGFAADAAEGAVSSLAFKKYVGSRALQPALAALETLPRLDPAAIEELDIATYPFSARLSAWAEPAERPIARQMHLPSAATRFVASRFAGEAFTAATYVLPLDGASAALAARIRVRAHAFGPPGAGPGGRIRRARVRVRTRSGFTAEAEAEAPFAPPPAGALRARFVELSRGSGLEPVWRLPEAAPVAELFGGAEAPARRGAASVRVGAA